MGSLVAGTELDGAVVGAMIVLDTNVVSEIVKARPHPSVVTWWNSHDAKEFYMTTITVAELLQGVNNSPEGRKSDELAETPDAMIAATAIAAEADAIATRDKDFADVGLPVLDPWSA